MNRFFLCILALAASVLLAQNSFKPASPKNAAGIEFVKIGPGEFMMGCSEGDAACNEDEKPVHRVRITKDFEIGKFEVTQEQWRAVMATDPSTIKGNNRPVESVTKDEVEDFLRKLTARNDGYQYRLPTEAEWEYAARAGSSTPYAGKLDDVAWYSENSGDETHSVGQKKPNAWGLYDTLGNVREWVADFYGANYYKNSPSDDPTGPVGGQRGGRGPRGEGPRGGPRGEPPFPLDGPPDGPPFPPGGPAIIADLQRQIDELRDRVDFLTQQLENQRGGQGSRGGGRGGPQAGGPQQPPPRGGRGNQAGGGQRGPGGPGGPGGGLPVMRGGAWDNLASYLRVSSRYNYYGSGLRVSDIGFRVVRVAVR